MDDRRPLEQSERVAPPGKVRHPDPIGIQPPGSDDSAQEATLASIQLAEDRSAGKPKQIRAIGVKSRRHGEDWARTPNTTGQGAIHVKTFHSKVTDDGLSYMDQQINEWLDEHPEYEVKIVETSIGMFSGKTQEPHVICQVWV